MDRSSFDDLAADYRSRMHELIKADIQHDQIHYDNSKCGAILMLCCNLVFVPRFSNPCMLWNIYQEQESAEGK